MTYNASPLFFLQRLYRQTIQVLRQVVKIDETFAK